MTIKKDDRDGARLDANEGSSPNQYQDAASAGNRDGEGVDVKLDTSKSHYSKKSSPDNHRHQGTDIVSEDAATIAFAEEYGGQLLYCHTSQSWFRWTGTHWQRENTGLAFHYARELARGLSFGLKDSERLQVSKVSFAAGVERFAKVDRTFAVEADAWDRDPLLLGTPGGTIDLRTGKMQDADPDDRITRVTAVAPIEQDDCPTWKMFLFTTLDGDADLYRFLQQWLGYCLTGQTSEHALLFLFGSGGNGKSVFLNVASAVLNGYAKTAGMETFTASRGERHPTDIAMLSGARFVTASETEDGKAWAEARIKQLTGGDVISARYMRQDFFSFVPAFKLTIAGNHKPILHNVDEATRRRFNIVPFTFKPAEPDRKLEEKLKAEWPGILRWMINGALDWQENGLVRPAVVLDATTQYFSGQDVFGQWLEEECRCEAGNAAVWAPSASLFESWSRYAERAGEETGSRRQFAEKLQSRGFVSARRSKGERVFEGVGLGR